MTYAQYEAERQRQAAEHQQAYARRYEERQAEERRRLALAERARADAARQVQEAEERTRREAAERAEAQRQAAEEQRRAFRRRLVRPCWWAYWAACGLWWVVRHALQVLARLAGEWWLVLWGDAYAYGPAQPFARACTALALVGILWATRVPIWQPATWIWEAVAGSVDAPAAHGDAQLEQQTCGELRTTVDLPLRAEPRLSAPMVLPAKLPKGAVVVSLCTTETSVERLAAGETTISWMRLHVEGEEGWANQAYLEEVR
jgi:hypothetical protein